MVLVKPCADLEEYYLDGLLKKLLDGLQDAVLNHETSCLIVEDGRSGLGKTTHVIQIAKYLDPTFCLDDIYFDTSSFLEGLSKAPKGKFILFDEAMILSSRSAMSELNKMVVVAMSMIRSKNIFVGFCINSIFDLDRNLSLSRCDLLLHVYGDNLIDRGNFCAFFKPKGLPNKITQLYLLGKKYYSYSKPKSNFRGRFTKRFLVNNNEYEKKKQLYINKYLGSKQEIYHKRDVMLRNACRYFKDELSFNTFKIAQIMDVSHQTIHNILNKSGKN